MAGPTKVPPELITGAGVVTATPTTLTATLDVGVTDGDLVVLDSVGLPAVDGSQLTGISTIEKATAIAAQTFAFGDSLVFAHGMASAPLGFGVYLKCVNTEHGYVTDDEILVNSGDSGGVNDRGFSAYLDAGGATNINVEVSNLAPVVLGTGGTTEYITAANWTIKVRAWA